MCSEKGDIDSEEDVTHLFSVKSFGFGDYFVTYDGVHVPLIREKLKGWGCHGELDDHLKHTC